MNKPINYEYGRFIGQDDKHVWIEFEYNTCDDLSPKTMAKAGQNIGKDIKNFACKYKHVFKRWGVQKISVFMEFDKK